MAETDLTFDFCFSLAKNRCALKRNARGKLTKFENLVILII